MCVCFHFIMNSSPHERHDEWNGTENSVFSLSVRAATTSELHCTLVSTITFKGTSYASGKKKNLEKYIDRKKIGYFERENKNMCRMFGESHSTEKKMHEKVRRKR